jgi:hypothetical protein
VSGEFTHTTSSLKDHALRAVDEALAAEKAPDNLTRMGQIRWLGDQRRRAERERDQVRRELDRVRSLGFPAHHTTGNIELGDMGDGF